MPQGLRGKRGLAGLAANLAVPAAAGDGDIESGFDLPQIFVERAAKVAQPLVVWRFEMQGKRVARNVQAGDSASPRSA